MRLYAIICCRFATLFVLIVMSSLVITMNNMYDRFEYSLTEKYNYTLTCLTSPSFLKV